MYGRPIKPCQPTRKPIPQQKMVQLSQPQPIPGTPQPNVVAPLPPNMIQGMVFEELPDEEPVEIDKDNL